MKIKFVHGLLIAILTICSSTAASADLVLSFSIDDGASFQNDYQVTTGDRLTIGIYLLELGADTILSDEGLLGFGLTAFTSPTDLGEISSATLNPVFDFVTTNSQTPTTIAWEAAAFANAAPAVSAIQLGVLRFDANSDGETLFTVADIQPGTGSANSNWLSAVTGTELDQEIFGPGSANTFQLSINASSAIPEPASLVLVSCVLAGVVLRRRRVSA